jgi:arginase
MHHVHAAGEIDLIGAAMGLGGPDPGAAEAPLRLRGAGLAERLSAAGVPVRWTPALLPRVMPGGRRATVAEFNRRLARRVASTLARGCFPLVVGGDHSIAAGTWTGVAEHYARRGPVGLVWVDAHMDAHTERTTPSGNPHGMPLATLLGADGSPAVLRAEHLALVGVRSYEAAEAQLLADLGARVYFQAEVAERGLDTVMREATERANTGTVGFGLTLDVDAIDPFVAPGTGTPVAGGLRASELAAALEPLGAHPRLVAAEIVEYSPRADRDRRTLRVVEMLAFALTRGLGSDPDRHGAHDRWAVAIGAG